MIKFPEIIFSNKNYSLEIIVTRVLFAFGIPANLKGYQYIREALIMAINDREAVNLITKVIYPDIAKKYCTTSSRVERSIRHAIEIAWQRCDSDCINDFFNFHYTDIRKRPTNSEFIATIADWLLINGCIEGTCENHRASSVDVLFGV